MAAMTFSVPEDVKLAFNSAFKAESKSFVIRDLMRRAIEEEL